MEALALANQIRTLHEELMAIGRNTVERAIEIGGLLVQAKSECRHGEWLDWLKDNVNFSQQTASNYVALYNKREGIKLLNDGNLELGHAYWLARRQEPPEHVTPKQWGISKSTAKAIKAAKQEKEAQKQEKTRSFNEKIENMRKDLASVRSDEAKSAAAPPKSPDDSYHGLRENLRGALANILRGTGKRREEAIYLLFQLLIEAEPESAPEPKLLSVQDLDLKVTRWWDIQALFLLHTTHKDQCLQLLDFIIEKCMEVKNLNKK